MALVPITREHERAEEAWSMATPYRDTVLPMYRIRSWIRTDARIEEGHDVSTRRAAERSTPIARGIPHPKSSRAQTGTTTVVATATCCRPRQEWSRIRGA
jgi:hypothetical protein